MVSKKLVLKEKHPKEYVTVNWENGISFVHNNETGQNFFSNKIIAECTGLDEVTVRRHWMKFKDLNNVGGTNVHDMNVSLKVLNINRPVDFKSFDFFTYVAYTSNKPEAVQMRNWIVKALDEQFNQDVGFTQPEQPKSLEQDVRKTIQYLRNKTWEETTLAFEAGTKREFNEHMDLADKYAMDANKRERQLRNAINCNKRLKRESELNIQGVLTESGKEKVFIPTTQSRLTDFSNNFVIESKNKRRLS